MYTIYHRNALVEKYCFFILSLVAIADVSAFCCFFFRNWIKRKECVRWRRRRWRRAEGNKSPCKQSHHVFCLAQIFNLWSDKSHHDARVLIYWWQDWRNARPPSNMILDIAAKWAWNLKPLHHFSMHISDASWNRCIRRWYGPCCRERRNRWLTKVKKS